jgi:hypothetical protein
MKTSTLKPKFTGQYESAPTIQTPWLPRDYEPVRQHTRAIYRARGGIMQMTLNDWLKAGQELNPKLAEQINHTTTMKRIMKTTNFDLTLDICDEDGSRTRFVQDGEAGVGKTLRQLVSPRLFSQPLLTLVSEHSVTAIPSRTIDLIQVHMESPPPLPLPPNWLDIVEVDDEAFLEFANNKESPEAKDEAVVLAEIHTVGDWMIRLKMQAKDHATVPDQRQLWAHFLICREFPFAWRAVGSVLSTHRKSAG